MGLPEQLKKARLAMGFTQQQVADAMGITDSTYCGYEIGKRQPDIMKIKRLSSILHISCDALLETDFVKIDAGAKAHGKLGQVVEIFQTLCPELQDRALEHIKGLAGFQEAVSSGPNE